jgi:hypothetical protein
MTGVEDRYRRALEEIKTEQGKVCENFELCTHLACQSSCASWFIADKALNPETYRSDDERAADQGQEGRPAEGRSRVEPSRQQVREAGGQQGHETVVVRGDRGEAVTLEIRLIHCDPLVLHSPGTCIHCDEHGLDLQCERLQKMVAFTDWMPLPATTHCLPCPAWQARGANCQVWGGNQPKSDATF